MSEVLVKDFDNNTHAMVQCFTGYRRVEKESYRFALLTKYEEKFSGYMDYGPLFSYDEGHPGEFEAILKRSLQDNKPYPEYLPENNFTPRPDWLPVHTLRG